MLAQAMLPERVSAGVPAFARRMRKNARRRRSGLDAGELADEPVRLVDALVRRVEDDALGAAGLVAEELLLALVVRREQVRVVPRFGGVRAPLLARARAGADEGAAFLQELHELVLVELDD